MKFEKPIEILSKELIDRGIKKPKLLLFPGRGEFLNRVAYKVFKGEYSVIPKEKFKEEIKPAKVLREVNGVKYLGLRGSEEADGVIVKGKSKERIDFGEVELKYPTVGVDFSFFNQLMDSEKKSLMVQIEIAYGIVKDYFTPESFVITSLNEESRKFLNSFFHPRFPFKEEKVENYEKVIVLDPSAEKEFIHEEVDEKTLILLGGIVDNGERLKGSTAKLHPHLLHRSIKYKGEASIVPDRINEIVKITCQYLTDKTKTLEETVRENLTRDSKLRWLRKKLQTSIVRFTDGKNSFKGIPEELYKKWKEEFDISEFILRKGAGHVGGFYVFKTSIFGKVIGEIVKRSRKFFAVKGDYHEDIIAKYP